MNKTPCIMSGCFILVDLSCYRLAFTISAKAFGSLTANSANIFLSISMFLDFIEAISLP